MAATMQLRPGLRRRSPTSLWITRSGRQPVHARWAHPRADSPPRKSPSDRKI